jgi:hypothetical protein
MDIILTGSMVMLLTVLIHAGACVLLVRWLAKRRHAESRAFATLASATVILLGSHLSHVLLWALLFQFDSLLSDFETAFYFAFTSYTTVGYGDVVLDSPWRILGTIAAADGYLMFGLSTAVLFAILQQVIIIPHFEREQKRRPAPAASNNPRSGTQHEQ